MAATTDRDRNYLLIIIITSVDDAVSMFFSANFRSCDVQSACSLVSTQEEGKNQC